MSFTTIAGILVLIFIYVVILQVAKSVEFIYTIKQKGKEDKYDTSANRVNSWLMIVALVIGVLAFLGYHAKNYTRTLTISGSKEGEQYDTVLLITFIITASVFLITHVLLFLFAFKYRAKDGHLGYYYTHNNKLELVWTLIPSLALVVLIGTGLKYWVNITGDAPKDAMVMEVTGKQYEWIFRYPGKDGVLGKKYYKRIDDGNNRLGQMWEDKANHDDIIVPELHLVVNRPVELLITSRDVVHDVGLPHFRMKMDAVPGLPTRMWFTPQYTTEQMRSKTNNPNFEYELVCDQMCGSGHYAMRAVVIVETQAEFDKWISSQKPYYASVSKESKDKIIAENLE